jgi:cardiolipin synthase (CMP-forming)
MAWAMKPLWLPNLLTVLRCFAAVGVALCLWLVLWPLSAAPGPAGDPPAATAAGLERLTGVRTGAQSAVGTSPMTLGEIVAAGGGDPDKLPEHLRDLRPDTDADGIILPAEAVAELKALEDSHTEFLLTRPLAIPPPTGESEVSPPGLAMLALALFLFAAVSDFLDGFLARRWNAQSDFGRLLDPIADKLLVGLPFLVIAALLIRQGDWRGIVFVALPMVLVIIRDLGVTALRFSPRGGAKVQVAALSKWKTALEMIVLGFFLAAPALSLPLSTATAVIWLAALWAAAVVSLYTGYRYFRAAF